MDGKLLYKKKNETLLNINLKNHILPYAKMMFKQESRSSFKPDF